MNEQNNGMVMLDGTLGQLPILKAWSNSSAVFWVKPSCPVTDMNFFVGNNTASAWAVKIKMVNHPMRGLWRVYVPGSVFLGRYETRYKITSVDEYGGRHVEGEGILRVFAGSIPDAANEVLRCYATFPDEKVREVFVSADETGTPVFTIGSVIDVPASIFPIYAYNASTGFYHLVSTEIDEVGVPMLSVAEKPSDGWVDSFVRDESGFYRRVECVTDETGETTLATGEAK